MLSSGPTRARLLAVLLVVGVQAAGAQDRVMIGTRPSPGQTVRVRMTQEMDFDLKPVGAASPGIPKEGIRSKGRSMLLLRQQVGTPEADGRLRFEITYEDVSQELSVNDTPLPIPQDSYDTLRGKTVAMWLGPKNDVLEVAAPNDFPIPPDQLKQYLGPLVASVPHREMSVGESVTLPFSMALPIPTPAGSAAPALTGHTKTTLSKVTPDGGDRLATLDQTIDVALDNTNETSAGSRVRMNVKIVGGGTTDIFVVGGLVKSSRTEATMSGQFSPSKDGPTLKLTGTLVMKVERVE